MAIEKKGWLSGQGGRLTSAISLTNASRCWKKGDFARSEAADEVGGCVGRNAMVEDGSKTEVLSGPCTKTDTSDKTGGICEKYRIENPGIEFSLM